MATSGSYDYSVTAEQVIQEMLEQIGVLAAGETLDADDRTSCLRSLNMMVKQWSGNFDFAPGLKAFSRKTGYIFLQKDQGSYTLGPSGDNATLSYDTTTMRIAGSATDTTLEVVSTSGMTAADYIGIELDSGSIYWTTITSITDSDTLVIPAPGLSGAAAIGNRIFAYTTKLIRPLYIENAVLRSTSTVDSPLETMTSTYYDRISNKNTDGTPSLYRYDNTLTNGTFYLDVQPSDITNVVRITFIVPAEDYDAATNDIAYPQEWYLALSLGLGKICAPKFNSALWTQLHESNFQSALSIARTSYAETVEDYFQPGLE